MRVQLALSVHHKDIPVMTMMKRKLGGPLAILSTDHRMIAVIVPTIKISDDAHAFGLGSDAYEMNRFRVSVC